MPYLNLDLDYFTHPKVERLVDALGVEAFHFPIRLWCYAGKHFPHNGILEGCSAKQIEKAIGWAGENGKLIDSLVKFGFLKQKGEAYQIHDWKEHAGHLSVFKKRAKSAAKKRWSAYATSIASSTRQAMLKKTQAYAPILTNPNQSSPNQTKPNQTKEEKKEKNIAAPSGERPVTVVEKPKSAESWEAYRVAYRDRYRVDPVSNAGVFAMLCKLVDKIGKGPAPSVAAFYVSHNSPHYVVKRHPVNLLLADAEGLHTQWATGVKATTGEAKNAERRDDALAQIQRIEAMRGGRG